MNGTWVTSQILNIQNQHLIFKARPQGFLAGIALARSVRRWPKQGGWSSIFFSNPFQRPYRNLAGTLKMVLAANRALLPSFTHGIKSAWISAWCRGRDSSTRVPDRRRECKRIRPPIRSTASRTTSIPTPRPEMQPGSGAVEKAGSVISIRRRGWEMPRPRRKLANAQNIDHRRSPSVLLSCDCFNRSRP